MTVLCYHAVFSCLPPALEYLPEFLFSSPTIIRMDKIREKFPDCLLCGISSKFLNIGSDIGNSCIRVERVDDLCQVLNKSLVLFFTLYEGLFSTFCIGYVSEEAVDTDDNIIIHHRPRLQSHPAMFAITGEGGEFCCDLSSREDCCKCLRYIPLLFRGGKLHKISAKSLGDR